MCGTRKKGLESVFLIFSGSIHSRLIRFYKFLAQDYENIILFLKVCSVSNIFLGLNKVIACFIVKYSLKENNLSYYDHLGTPRSI